MRNGCRRNWEEQKASRHEVKLETPYERKLARGQLENGRVVPSDPHTLTKGNPRPQGILGQGKKGAFLAERAERSDT